VKTSKCFFQIISFCFLGKHGNVALLSLLCALHDLNLFFLLYTTTMYSCRAWSVRSEDLPPHCHISACCIPTCHTLHHSFVNLLSSCFAWPIGMHFQAQASLHRTMVIITVLCIVTSHADVECDEESFHPYSIIPQ
jgi:hypothetical protein